MKQNQRGGRSLHAFDFTQLFQLPVLPGDFSLIGYYLEDLAVEARRINQHIDWLTVSYPATVLQQLVILRVYLNKEPMNDMEIFFLSLGSGANQYLPAHLTPQNALFGTLRRIPMLPEQARGAGLGPDHNTRFMLPSPDFAVIRIKVDIDSPSLELPLVYARQNDGKAYEWAILENASLFCLVGGEAHKSRLLEMDDRHTASPTKLVIKLPKPKPRPVTKRKSLDNTADDNEERLAKKAKLIRGDGERRSERTRKTVKWGPSLVAGGKPSPKGKQR